MKVWSINKSFISERLISFWNTILSQFTYFKSKPTKLSLNRQFFIKKRSFPILLVNFDTEAKLHLAYTSEENMPNITLIQINNRLAQNNQWRRIVSSNSQPLQLESTNFEKLTQSTHPLLMLVTMIRSYHFYTAEAELRTTCDTKQERRQNTKKRQKIKCKIEFIMNWT